MNDYGKKGQTLDEATIAAIRAPIQARLDEAVRLLLLGQRGLKTWPQHRVWVVFVEDFLNRERTQWPEVTK